MARLQCSFFGGFEVRLGGEVVTGFESSKVRALLVYLAVEVDRPQRREMLAGLIWPDWPQQSAMNNLRYALADLRKNIGDRDAQPPFLLISRESIQLNPEADIWVDVDEFLSLEGSEEGLETAIERLRTKIELYQGAFLAGFSLPDSAPYEEWQTLKREQLQREFMAALGQQVESYAIYRDYEQALLYAHRLVEMEPWLEEGHRQIMRLLALNGQRGAALSQYENCQAVLEKELGVKPGPETDWVYESIREGKLEHIQYGLEEAGKTLPPEPGQPPFKGLQYFDVSDADLFYGREALTARLVGHIRKMVEASQDQPESCCFLSVVGASGSGKSSVIRAGVVPALQRGEILADGSFPPEGSSSWHIHVFAPTAHPLEALAVSLTMKEPVTRTAELMDSFSQDERSMHLYAQRLLAPQEAVLRGKCRLLLVVDQFEELFTLCRSETERTAFVNNLLTAVRGGGSTQVIVVLRADFYGHCAQYPLLREALCVRQEYIGPMTEAELRSAIEQPAVENGWRFEPGLVELILRDVGEEPGALPLLEHALLETWQRRTGRMLTVQGYADSGGVRGAIAKTAESVYASLPAVQQDLARRIFLRLTELGEGTQDTRRRVTLSELIPGDAGTTGVEVLLKRLADARLITVAEDTAEVAHEALIREWPALRNWLSEDREGLRLHRHLTESAEAWEDLDRDVGELYRGARLQQVLEWAAEHKLDLNTLETQFLQASQAREEAETMEREKRRQRELEAAQRLARTQRQRSIVLSIGLVIALVLTAVALWLNSVANTNLHLANDAQMTAENEAFRRATQEVLALQEADLRATQAGIADEARQMADESRQLAEDESALSKSRELAAAAISNLVQDPQLSLLLAVQAYQVAHTREAEAALHRAVQASHLQKVLHSDPAVRGSYHSLTDLAFSPDDRLLAALNDQNNLQVFDTATGDLLYTYLLDEELQALQQPDIEVSQYFHLVWSIGLEFFPNGSLCLEGKRWFVILDADTGQELYRGTSGAEGINVLDVNSEKVVFNFPLPMNPGTPIFIEYTPVGLHLLVYNQEESNAIGNLDVYNLLTGEPVISFQWQRGTENWYTLDRIEYSPDGKFMALTLNLGTFEIWDLASQQRIATLSGMPSISIEKIAFSPDNAMLAVKGKDGTIKVWDIASEKEILNLSGTDAFFTPNNQQLVVADAKRQLHVWHIPTQHELYHFLCHPLQTASTLSATGLQLASGGRDGSIHLCEVAPDYEDHVWVSEYPLVKFGYAPEPGLLAIAETDNAIHFFDAETGELFKNHPLPIGAGLIDFGFFPNGSGFHTLESNYTLFRDRIYISRFWETVSGTEISRQSSTDANVENQGGVSRLDGSSGILIENVVAFEIRHYDTKILSPFLWFDWTPFEVHACTFSPDGNLLALSKVDGRIGIFDSKTYTQVMTVTLGGGYTVMIFNPTSTRLAVGDQKGGVSILDVEKGQIVLSLPQQAAAINAITYSPDESLLAIGTADGVVRLWDPGTGEEILELVQHEAPISLLSFNHDGTHIISGSDDGVARSSVVNVNELLSLAGARIQRTFTSQEVARYRIEYKEDLLQSLPEPPASKIHTVELAGFPIPSRSEPQIPRPPSAPISSENITQIEELGWSEIELGGINAKVAVSPDGKYIATSGLTLLRTLYDFTTMKPVWQQKVNNLVDAMIFSPDSKLLATVSEDGWIHLLRVADGEEIISFTGHEQLVSGLAFSPDGKLLASGAQDGVILLYSISDGKLVTRLTNEVYSLGIAGLVFSPDGSILASGSGDGKVRFWDIQSQQVRLEFQASVGAAGPVSFSPDGIYFTTGDSSSLNGSRVWRVADGSLVFEIPNGGFPTFFPNGSLLMTCNIWIDGTSYIYKYYFWDPSDGMLLHSFDLPGLMLSFFITQDNQFLGIVPWDYHLHLYGIP
jgi:WD40 repeat protein/DNA-binding SARP family transcriptional activator